jgi:prolyl-tRNA editing enzyme YbaK/EbsC (Cys-tRNA(Pro) deacylase)
MHPNAEGVQTELKARGGTSEFVELAASTRTAQEAAAATGTTVAQIVKSLLFLAGNDPVLVLASGSNRVSLAKLAAHLGAPSPGRTPTASSASPASPSEASPPSATPRRYAS